MVSEPYAGALFAGATIVGVAAVTLWLGSLRRRDVSIVDVFWGVAFVVLVWTYRVHGPPAAARHLVQAGLVTVWGLRLAAFIARRRRGEGEDRRYAAMRARRGPAFRFTSLSTVFLLQGVIAVAISAPLLVLQVAPVAPGLRLLDVAAIALWAVGFAFEAGGDAQMARFRGDPANRGRVLDRGFWRYTRHPNYFGDAAQHWAFYLLALGTPGSGWAVAGPLLMTFLLLRVSGVTLLERDIGERRPAYRRYQETTSAFLPRPPRRRGPDG